MNERNFRRRSRRKLDFQQWLELLTEPCSQLPLNRKPRMLLTAKEENMLALLTVMIICDCDPKIRCCHSGHPGSAHDNRVYRNMDLFQHPENCFSENKFSIGDSTFSNSPFMVLSCKTQTGKEIPEEQDRFNKLLSKVCTEHTIGILKGCFPWLRKRDCFAKFFDCWMPQSFCTTCC